MSGPTLQEQICYNDAEDMATMFTVRKLRNLADYVEDMPTETGDRYPDLENKEHVAELLRLKADKIEASLRVIENHTQSQDFKDLLKAIQWTRSGDYGHGSIQLSWEEYGEDITIEVEK